MEPQEKKYEEIVRELDNGTPSLDFTGMHLSHENIDDLIDKVNNNRFVGNILWGTLPPLSEGKVETIEAKLIKNNKNYQHNPKNY